MSQIKVTEGSPDLEAWLKQFKIKEEFAKQYVNSLKELGVESVDDFKYIEDKNDLDELLKNLKGIRFMDKKKIEKAWRSLHAQEPQAAKPQNVGFQFPVDAKERAAFETLGKYAQKVQQKLAKYEPYMNDSKFLTTESNMIRQQIESLKNAIDARGNALIKQLQVQYNGIQKECSAEYKKWKEIAMKIHATKANCDQVLKISDFQQLETRRNTIINCVDETANIVQTALDDISIADNKKIVVDLDEFKALEESMKNVGRVYTQCFAMNVTHFSVVGTTFSVQWQLENEKEATFFKSVCSKIKVKIGVVGDGDDEKKAEQQQPGHDKRNNIGWIDEIIHDDVSNYKIEKSAAKILRNVKDKNILVVQVVALDNNNKVIQQTECKYFECEDEGIAFIGYVDWTQEYVMGKDEEDNAMNKVCQAKYTGSGPATYKELFDGRIKGLVKPDRDYYTLLHSGNDDLWKGGAYQNGNRLFYRKGFKKAAYPWNQPWTNGSTWSGCSGDNRLTIAVNRSFVYKPI